MQKSKVSHSSPFQIVRVSGIDSSHKFPNLQPFSLIPYETNPPSLSHFGLVSKGSFGVLRRQIYYRLFERDSVGLLIDEIESIRVTHGSKIIGIRNKNWWNQNFIPHFLETSLDEFKKKEKYRVAANTWKAEVWRHTLGTWLLVAIVTKMDLNMRKVT